MSYSICENKFCIYYERGRCKLEAIRLDDLGNCQEALWVSIPDDYLRKKRHEMLRKLSADEKKALDRD